MKSEARGHLLPIVVQHYSTGEVLMLGYGNEESLQRCRDTGELWLYSRSRQQLWHKGETSGNTQRVVTITNDCDNDTILIRVDPAGPICHNGTRSCFNEPPTLAAIADTIAQRASSSSDASYTAKLLEDENLRLKKLGEESVELAIACQAGDKQKAAEEAADLIYHTLVACAAIGTSLDDILAELDARRR